MSLQILQRPDLAPYEIFANHVRGLLVFGRKPGTDGLGSRLAEAPVRTSSDVRPMARPLRIEFAGAVYHVMARGNARQSIYLDDRDRRVFLSRLWELSTQLEWRIWAYCLMDNHYHLLLETRRPNLTRGMHDLNGAYSQRFNQRYGRCGHVFQGKYKSIVVDQQSYLLEVSRYIVANPVRSGLCETPGQWRWSSYLATLGRAHAPAPLAVLALLGNFGADRTLARKAFAAFVNAGLTSPDPATTTRLQTVVGEEPFVAEVAARAPAPPQEVRRADRTWTSIEQFAGKAADRNSAIRTAYASGLHTQAAIARHFGLHYVTVNRIVRGAPARMLKLKDLTP